MKFLIILALVTLAAADWKPKSREELRQARRDCMKNLNVSQDLKDKANRLELPDKDEVKEFVLCGARSSELWTDEKGWQTDRVLILLEGDSDLSKEEIREIIDGCLDDNSQGSPLKDWAFRNYKCVIESKLRSAFIKIMKKIE